VSEIIEFHRSVLSSVRSNLLDVADRIAYTESIDVALEVHIKVLQLGIPCIVCCSVRIVREDETLEIQIEIVTHIVKTKLDEIETAKQSKEIKEKKQKIMEIMAAKKDEALQNMSVDELQAMLDNLG
jgi:hypothetical protein